MRSLKLGTRRSLLAMAQSTWVARRVESLNPGLKIELVGIETQGDRIQDVPLQSVQGKEFFVAELDQALARGEVDLTVHSMKDLSLERPAAFVNACTPPRENPRDVILFGPRAQKKLQRGEPLRIGTSSPRRIENIPSFLRQALPGPNPQVRLLEIRGNVNTRLSRVHLPEEDPKSLEGVVLAFAGLIRLWADEGARRELASLLRGVRWMVLPLHENPTAPAQGALAVECRADDSETRAALAKLHDPASASLVARERQLLADWSGGCHQRFGATATVHPLLGELFQVRGIKPDGTFVEEFQWNQPENPPSLAESWDPSELTSNSEALELQAGLGSDWSGKTLFIAHSRALPESLLPQAAKARIWCSGTQSWFKLARLGLWVEGCAESLGFEFLEPTLQEGVLQLDANNLIVLTHEEAAPEWRQGKVVATYRTGFKVRPEQLERLRSARSLYWGSSSQYRQLGKEARKEALHACGPGKTAHFLRSQGVDPVIFPSIEEWRKWHRS